MCAPREARPKAAFEPSQALTTFRMYLASGIVVSDFRQVPDNQEVLVRDDSDISLIVEVLQLATDEGAESSLDTAVR